MRQDGDRLTATHRGSKALVVVCTLLAVSLLWSLMAYHLVEKRGSDLSQARRDAGNISTVLAEQVSRLIDDADLMLRVMQTDHDRAPDRFDLQEWIKRTGSLGGVANQIAVFDARGDLVAAMRTPTRRVNIADRPAFSYIASHPDAGLYIGRTYPSRLQQAMVIPLVRRLSGADGGFAGTISISLDPMALMRQFQALDIGPGGSVALYGRDGYIRARVPAVPNMFERPLGSPWWRNNDSAIARLADDGRAAGPDARIDSVRDVADRPLSVAVGFSRDDVLAAWRAEVRRVLGFGIAATVALLLLAGLLLREQERRAAREAALRRSRDALIEAESGFRDVFESLPEVLALFRVDGGGAIAVDALNGAAQAYFAGGDGAVIDVARIGVVAPALPDRIAGIVRSRQVARHLDAGDTELLLVPLLTGDGRRVARIFLSLRDVSHLRRAETAVARSEERFRLLAEGAGDMITRLDPQTLRREYVSPACRRLLGFEAEDLLQRRTIEDVHPDDVAKVKAVAVDLFSSEGPDETIVSYRTRHKAGHWIWVEGRLNLSRDDAGAPIAIVCAVRDITDRHNAEAALKASEGRFRLLAENTSELIVLSRQDGVLTYVSPASHRLLGYMPDELAAEMATHRWVHPDDREQLARAMLEAGSTPSVLCRVRHRSGAWMWVEAIVRTFAAGPAEPTTIATFRDVSERVMQAQALQRAKEAAEQASQAKSDFLAAMSHEIRTPLNAVLGYADLLLHDGGLSARQRLNLERIENAGSALRTVVDDVLDFSKIEAGEIELAERPFRPCDLVDNAVSIMRGAVQAKGLDLVVELAAAVPPTVVGDHDRLRQILLNMLNNAVKFTRDGTVTLKIGLAGDAARLRYCVADTGIGIAPSGLDRLFQRFSQVDGSISRDFGGTGLGLAICRRLVEAMGGAVGVESELGRGSLFWFEVPLVVPPQTATGATGALPEPQLRPLDLLLVEDQPLNRELARAVLETAGHRVIEVENGAAAIAAVLDRSFDAVLMDVQMPVMDGIEATRRIRSLPGAVRSVPIIAMTANVLPAQVEELRDAGVGDHVGKPFRRDELLTAVARATASAGPQAAAAPDHPVFDLATYRELGAAIGPATVQRIAADTLTQTAALLSGADGSGYAARAHALLGTAGTVGLIELAAGLKELEAACLAGRDPRLPLAQLEAALSRTQVALSGCGPSASAA